MCQRALRLTFGAKVFSPRARHGGQTQRASHLHILLDSATSVQIVRTCGLLQAKAGTPAAMLRISRRNAGLMIETLFTQTRPDLPGNPAGPQIALSEASAMSRIGRLSSRTLSMNRCPYPHASPACHRGRCRGRERQQRPALLAPFAVSVDAVQALTPSVPPT